MKMRLAVTVAAVLGVTACTTPAIEDPPRLPVSAETYQADVGTFKDPSLNAAIMTVGGVEARHAALLRSVLMQTPVPKAFQVTDMAVQPGTGV